MRWARRCKSHGILVTLPCEHPEFMPFTSTLGAFCVPSLLTIEMELDESLVLRIGSPGTHLVLALASDSYEFTGESPHFRRRGWVLLLERAASGGTEPTFCKAVPELIEAMSEKRCVSSGLAYVEGSPTGQNRR